MLYRLTEKGYRRLQELEEKRQSLDFAEAMSTSISREMGMLMDIDEYEKPIRWPNRLQLQRLIQIGYVQPLPEITEKVVYHVTPSRNIPKILQEGLKTEYYGTVGFDDLGPTFDKPVPSRYRKIYVFPSKKEVTVPEIGWSVLEVRLPSGTKLSVDEEWPGVGLTLSKDIPSEAVRVLSREEVEVLRGGQE